jgi:hypothetical protein
MLGLVMPAEVRRNFMNPEEISYLNGVQIGEPVVPN